MSNLEEWCGLFDNKESLLYRLYCCPERDVEMFETKRRYLRNHFYFYTTPVFHVWFQDKCIMSTVNYREALDKYKKLTDVKREV